MSNIWVPRVKVLESELHPHSVRIQGEYTLRRHKADTGELVQEIGPFSNLITDFGLNRLGTSGAVTYIFVGTGTAPAAVSDTQLQNYVAYTSLGSWNPAAFRGGSPDYWVQGSSTARFGAGVATGTLTEVGAGIFSASPFNAVNHRASSRALIVDSMGMPVSITVLPDEYLDVTYSMRYYPYTGSDVVQVVNLSGTDYTFTSRSLAVLSAPFCDPQFAMSNSGFINFFTGTAAGTPPSLASIEATNLGSKGSGSGNITPTQHAYVNGSYTLNATLTAGLSQANLTYGIRGAELSVRNAFGSACTPHSFQTVVSPAIPKDATKVLSFGTSFSWARYTP